MKKCITACVLGLVLAAGSATANECKQFGAAQLADGWNWHYPKETPNMRNGLRTVICNNGHKGYVYTRDDIPGQYFVTDTKWVRKTNVRYSICDVIAQYCAQ